MGSPLSDALTAKTKCGAECYTKGRGCTVSENGQCPHLYVPGNIHGVKLSTKDYFTPPKDYKKIYGI